MTARTKFTSRQLATRDARRDSVTAKIRKVKTGVGPKGLAMEEDVYRAMLERVTGNRSLTLCTESEIDQVLRELDRLGAKPKHPGKAGTRKMDSSPEGRLIRAIWLQLAAMGEVKNPSEAALAAYVKRIGKVDALQWLQGSKVDVVVETLKQWAVRAFPKCLRDLWEQLAAQGKRPEYSDAALQAFIASNVAKGAFKSATYENLSRCWDKLRSELGVAS